LDYSKKYAIKGIFKREQNAESMQNLSERTGLRARNKPFSQGVSQKVETQPTAG
jgi:hypothetical protein